VLARGEAAPLKNRLILIGLASFTFLLLRITTLATSLETVSWDEELQRGTIARELTVGLKAPLWDYRADSYSGGSLVVGLLAAPLFWAFGPRLIVLKLVPLTISLVTLGLLITLLGRYHSRRAAWVGASLFILAPPFPSQLSLFAMGYHTDSIIFSVLLMLAWAHALERPDGHAPFSLGLIAGLAFSFTYITAITTLGCLLCSGPLLRRGGAAAKLTAGLAFGLAPWAAYNLTHHFDGVRIAQVWFTSPEGVVTSLSRFVLRLGWRGATLLVLAVPLSFGFPTMMWVPGPVWSYTYCGLTVAPIIWLLLNARVRPPVVRPLVASALVFLAVYPFTRFAVPTGGSAEEFRHFVPLQFALLTVLALSLAETPFGKTATVALITLGALGQATLPGRHPAPRLLDYRGYSYFAFGSAWGDRIDPVAPQANALLEGFDERTRRLIYWGALSSAPWRTPARLVSRIHEVAEDYRPYVAEAMGRAAGLRQIDFVPLVATIDAVPLDVREHFTLGYGVDLRARPDTLLPDVAALRGLPPSLRRWCHFGVGRLVHEGCVDSKNAARCRVALDVIEASDPDAASWIYRGAGAAAVGDWPADPTVDVAHIGPLAVPPHRRADFAWGLGWGIRDGFKEDIVRARDWVARLGSVDRAAALNGVSFYDAFYRLETEAGMQHSR
jgi:hypothetical protein